MTVELLETLVFATIRSATPLVIAGLGILILEKSGVLNLGQEGVFSMGAVIGFIAAYNSDSYLFAILMAVLVGILLVCVFAFVVFICKANQVVSGLALSILGVGLSAFIGAAYVGKSIVGVPTVNIPLLTELPIIGRGLFGQDIFVYLTIAAAPAIAYMLYRTKWGMLIRAVGENPEAAHALGYNPNLIRFIALVTSGALVAVAGAYLTLVYTPILSEGISAGRGWIALALVVFASRLIGRLFLGAFIFGFTSIMHLALQGFGLPIDGSILAMLPYVITIVALVYMSIRANSVSVKNIRNQKLNMNKAVVKAKFNAEPRALGTNFTASH